MLFICSRTNNGPEQVDLVGEPESPVEISAELVDGGWDRVTRNGVDVTIRADNGTWTYRIASYDIDRKVYIANLLPTAQEIPESNETERDTTQ
jgi:hypothetical protein